ncbi:hypothetical protein QQS21_012725 [Conoideocrella luteorostrata]|uniref:Uncharacterized protein n=1 Tax=Conoideocrella luteorostrata TaxID=1105319 RepID=A0AAJ0CDH5_9HYPO|nr:hypothetical protein QQS21_012725 [Conoideocrella luteorostrata]
MNITEETDPADLPTHRLNDIKAGDHSVQLLVSTKDHLYDAESVEAGTDSWQVIGAWGETSVPELSKMLSNRHIIADRNERERFLWNKEPNEAWRANTAGLLGVLVISPAADSLPLPEKNGNVAEKLFAIRQKEVRESSLKFGQLRPLVNAVVANSPDTDIWAAVMTLIEAVNPSTPPPTSIVPTSFGTPVSRSSSRLANSETRDVIERELFYEIRNRTH